MFYKLNDLNYVVRRDFRLEGEFEISRHAVILKACDIELSTKPGVMFVKPRIKIENFNRLAMVKINPILLAQAEVTAPSILDPDDKDLVIVVRPLTKELEVEKLDYIAKLFIYDGKLL